MRCQQLCEAWTFVRLRRIDPAPLRLHTEWFLKSKFSTEAVDFLNQLLAFIAFRNPGLALIAECDPFDKRTRVGLRERVPRRRNDA